MNNFSQSVAMIFKGAYRAFRTFPVSIASAVAFAIVTMIKIQLEWAQQESLNFLFSCLNWSFALGAILGMALIVAERSRINRGRAFLTVNLLGLTAMVVCFLGLYMYGGRVLSENDYTIISSLASARVSAAILVSLIAFVILSGDPRERFEFTSSFFMTLKAFFIALVYGLVILAGASGVARAFQALLYREMSGKVYMYILTLACFLAFTIFIGYFPDFRKGEIDEHRETAQKQPRFIEILFVYIMVPIVLALTVVLLIWAGITVFKGMQVPFLRLSGIAAAYTIGGLWLHAMVSEHESGMARLYRRVYPIASFVILAFEAWAVIKQLQGSGLKTAEYSFILIWIIAAVGAGMLLVKKSKAHRSIAVLICALAIIAVLPVVGYQALPVRAQVSRLEKLLNEEQILESDRLTPALSEPSAPVRIAITDAVNYLAYTEGAKLPSWFERDLRDSVVFKTKLGFEQTWANTDGTSEPGQYLGTYLHLASEAVDISDYRWAVNPQNDYKDGQAYVTVGGDKGIYKIYWTITSGTGIPSLKILLNDQAILEQDMGEYIKKLSEKYPPSQAGNVEATLEDMSLALKTSKLDILLVFNNIQISVDTSTNATSYYLDLKNMYLKENS
jgi:hypothetical protein